MIKWKGKFRFLLILNIELKNKKVEINNLKYLEVNNEIELLKKTYEKTLQQEQNIKISLISSNKLL